MEQTKFCCNGQNAKLVLPLWPQKRKDHTYHTAIYKCKKCHELTLRGETNQKKSFNTFVEFISPETLNQYKKEKKDHVAKKNKRTCRKT